MQQPPLQPGGSQWAEVDTMDVCWVLGARGYQPYYKLKIKERGYPVSPYGYPAAPYGYGPQWVSQGGWGGGYQPGWGGGWEGPPVRVQEDLGFNYQPRYNVGPTFPGYGYYQQPQQFQFSQSFGAGTSACPNGQCPMMNPPGYFR
jgi:hypothetical protein